MLKQHDTFTLEDKPEANPSSASRDDDRNRELCLKLIHAESEEQVENILKDYGYWDKSEYWRSLGDNDSNFSIVGAQQNRADCALVEKIINSIDAVLIGRCKRAGIDVKGGVGTNTPQSIKEGVIQFFKVPEADMINLEQKEASDLAKNVLLIATGSKEKPCFIIADKGEGQHPENFPDTFLSITRGNKIEIPFVQGKFNMGGTGVFRFLGQKGVQLILSRKDPAIEKGKWGFTICRREKPKGNQKSSVIKYLVGSNNETLSFTEGGLPILPGDRWVRNPYVEPMSYGTFIKLYNYELGVKGAVQRTLDKKLTLLIPGIALPVRLFERRAGYFQDNKKKPSSNQAILKGLHTRFFNPDEANSDLEVPMFKIDLPPIREKKLNCSVYVFKEKKKLAQYARDEGIIYTINGQFHGHENKTFYTRKKIKLDYIGNSLLIELDCGNLNNVDIEEVFMNSRDRVNTGSMIYKEIQESLIECISENPKLKELNIKRREEKRKENFADNKPLAEILSKLIKENQMLSSLLAKGNRISNPSPPDGKMKIELKKNPDFFKLKRKYPKENPKVCEIFEENRTVIKKFRVEYETNAKNDYFYRMNNPGTLELKINGEIYNDYRKVLHQGIMTLTVYVNKEWKPKDVIEIESSISAEDIIKTF